MQIMFIWILIIIYWNFLNSIVNMANFWERLMMEEEEMLTWTEIQRKLWSPVLESKDATACSVSSSDSWVPLILLGRHCVCPVGVCLAARTEQAALTACDSTFPPAEAQGVLLSRARLSPALESRDRRKALEQAQRWQEETQCAWGLSLAGLAETRVFRVS